MLECARQQVLEGQLLRPAPEVLPVQPVSGHLQDAQDVPPLAIRNLVTQSVPTQLLKQRVLGRCHAREPLGIRSQLLGAWPRCGNARHELGAQAQAGSPVFELLAVGVREAGLETGKGQPVQGLAELGDQCGLLGRRHAAPVFEQQLLRPGVGVTGLGPWRPVRLARVHGRNVASSHAESHPPARFAATGCPSRSHGRAERRDAVSWADPMSAADPPLDELVVECLERLEDEGPGALDALCAAHPQRAHALRERIESLRGVGLLEGTSAGEEVPDFPDALGEFRLLERIGGGGMGVVYRAEQPSLDRTVALKLIRPEQLYFPGARERFRREVLVAAQLSHPGIVPVHSVGEEDGVPYFTMEVVQGASLAEIIESLAGRDPARLAAADLRAAVGCAADARSEHNPPRPPGGTWVEACIDIARQVAQALGHAHRRSVLHRDIKPSNVLLDREGRALLCDFGLASSRGEERLTRAGTFVGSLPYMAPELLEGGREADARADVYSLGVTLYELLTLQNPFLSERSDQIARRVQAGERARPREWNARISGDLETVVLTAMDVDPERRYASAEALAQDLTNVLEHRPISARPASARLKAWRWTQRHPGWATAVGLGVLVVVGGPLAFAVQQRAARVSIEAQKQEAERQRNWAEADFRRALEALDLLTRVGSEDLEHVPRAGRARQRLLHAALEFHLDFLEQRGDRPELVERTARSYLSAGRIHSSLGQYEDGRAALEQSIARFEELPDPSVDQRRELAEAYGWLAGIRDSVGQPQESIAAEGRAIEILTALVEQPDALPQDRVSLATRRVALASGIRSDGRPAEAERILVDVRADLEALAPRVEVRNALAGALNELAQCAVDQGRWADAVEPFHSAVAVLTEFAEERSLDRYIADSAMAARASLAVVLNELDRPDEALEQLRVAATLGESLVRDYPSFPAYQNKLMIAYVNIASIYRETGRRELAREPTLRAKELGERLLMDFPDSVQYAMNVAGTLPNLASDLMDSGEHERAFELLEDALEETRTLVERFPTAKPLHNVLLDTHMTMVLACQALGKHGEAVDYALSAPTFDRAMWCRVAANYVCKCIAAAGRDPTLSATERRETQDRYARIAIDFARQTGEFGYEQSFFESLQEGEWAAALRGRPEFDELIAEMGTALRAQDASE